MSTTDKSKEKSRKRKVQSQYVITPNITTSLPTPTTLQLHGNSTTLTNCKYSKLNVPLDDADLPQPSTEILHTSNAQFCSYIMCSDIAIDGTTDSRVEVKTYQESDKKAGKRSGLWRVNWSINGEATFHGTCWEELLNLTNSRKKVSPALVTIEKCMIKEAIKTAEFHDSLTIIQEKAYKVSQMISSSKHCVVFTGAGISTSAGIGDYRGKSGKWTVEDLATESGSDVEEGVPYDKLRPTYTHEAIQLLVEKGFIKHVITQNGDGLHLLSGIPVEKLSELHGNVFMESCEKCKQVYYRDFYTLDDYASLYYEEIEDFGETDIIKPKHAKKCTLCKLNHRTGRKCEKSQCKGQLIDSIINFKDLLSEDILSKATDNAKMNDLCLSLGTTMQVYPACDLVEMGLKPLRLTICNRQSTPFDDLCYSAPVKHSTVHTGNAQLGCRIYGDCDLFIKEVLKCLLNSDELNKWEEIRDDRLIRYDSLRK